MAGRKRWWRWLLVCLAALVVTVPLAAGLVVELQHVPAPLALPAAAARRPTGPLAGSWSAAAGSVAGFRVRESAVGWSNDVVGRTTRVTGAVVISGREVASAKFQVGLAGVTAGGKPQPQFLASLHASRDPVADVTLARPVALPRAFAAGATVTARAPARLALNGVNRPVTVTITARRSGAAVQLAGSIPVQFSAWRISGPTSYGFIASLADSGVAEFYLVLHR